MPEGCICSGEPIRFRVRLFICQIYLDILPVFTANVKVITIKGEQGITETTGVDYPGETGSIMYQLDDVGPVELATIGYGQSISVTPIQLLTAVSAIGNDGVLLQPRYVKALTDKSGKVVKEFETQKVRKVLSQETAKQMQPLLHVFPFHSGQMS